MSEPALIKTALDQAGAAWGARQARILPTDFARYPVVFLFPPVLFRIRIERHAGLSSPSAISNPAPA